MDISKEKKLIRTATKMLIVSDASDRRYADLLVQHLSVLTQGAGWSYCQRIEEATAILFLVSPASISDPRALRILDICCERNARNELLLFPILARPCAWQMIQQLKGRIILPAGTPITEWSDVDRACTRVVEDIYQAAMNWR